jgi:hypothetical protein
MLEKVKREKKYKVKTLNESETVIYTSHELLLHKNIFVLAPAKSTPTDWLIMAILGQHQREQNIERKYIMKHWCLL